MLLLLFGGPGVVPTAVVFSGSRLFTNQGGFTTPLTTSLNPQDNPPEAT